MIITMKNKATKAEIEEILELLNASSNNLCFKQLHISFLLFSMVTKPVSQHFLHYLSVDYLHLL